MKLYPFIVLRVCCNAFKNNKETALKVDKPFTIYIIMFVYGLNFVFSLFVRTSAPAHKWMPLWLQEQQVNENLFFINATCIRCVFFQMLRQVQQSRYVVLYLLCCDAAARHGTIRYGTARHSELHTLLCYLPL